MKSFWQDLRYGLRSLQAHPGFTAVAVFSLALGIGANVSIFSAVDVFMIRPLPYEEPDRLLHVFSTVPERGWTNNVQSVPDFLDIREQSTTMNAATSRGSAYNMSGDDEPERISGDYVSWNFFEVLRVQPVLGRTFRPEEEVEGEHRVAVISDRLWKRRFGADAGVVGRTILLDDEPYTIIGVLPDDFWYESTEREIYTPIGVTGEENRGSHSWSSFARLEDGATIEQARAEVEQITARLEEAFPDSNQGWSAGVQSLHEEVFDEGFRMGSLISSVSTAFVLLIACANVANLMLTRVAGRGREIAVRRALGAGPGRIVRQLLTEATIVSFLGGALGIVVSIAGIRGLVSLIPVWFPFRSEVGLNGRVLLFALALTALTPILFGILPALQSARPDITDNLKEGSRGNVGNKGDRLRKVLVVAEVSLALTLLVSSALLVQGFFNVRYADFGWNEENLLTFRVTLPPLSYPDDEMVSGFHRRFLSSVESLPGVASVGGTAILPLQGDSNTFYQVPGQEYARLTDQPLVSYRFVFPEYFESMEIPILRGRTFTEADRPDSRAVIVVNEVVAERHWPGEDPIGKQIDFWDERREIVGVVRSTLDAGREARATAFISAFQSPTRAMSFTVRTADDPGSMTAAIRSELGRIDPDLPMYAVQTMAELREVQQGGDTVMAKIMGALAAIALSLSVVGVYGVMSYTVSQKSQEMGIRMALGAQRLDVMRMVVRQGTLLALIGVLLGMGLAAMVTRSLSFFLHGVSPFDPLTFVLVSVTLLVAALLATVMPAQRATRVDPLSALRTE